MTVQELGTLAACGARVVVVVLDNSYLGMVRQWQELYHGRRYSETALDHNPDFRALAEAYGIPGRRAANPGELADALDSARSARGPMLVHVPVARESNIMPMVPPGGRLRDFFGECIATPGRFFSASELARCEGSQP
jgi:acetolactate synthase-1/2/3 large subunit